MRRKLLWAVLAAALGVAAFPLLLRVWAGWHYGSRTYSVDNVPPQRVAIVFGARIYGDGRLSPMLRDRVETAVQLYQAGKVDKLLLSGDNRFADYDEPGRMMEYALARGVPAADMQPDYAGRRTYDSCYRAQEIFAVDSAVLVTQNFHMPRALFTCDRLGLEVVGVTADLQPYSRRSLAWSELREIPALTLALIDTIRRAPAEVLGDPIPIQ